MYATKVCMWRAYPHILRYLAQRIFNWIYVMKYASAFDKPDGS